MQKRKPYILKGLQTAIVILLSFALATVRLFRREKYYNSLMEKSTDLVVSVDLRTGETTFVDSSIHEVLGYRVEQLVKMVNHRNCVWIFGIYQKGKKPSWHYWNWPTRMNSRVCLIENHSLDLPDQSIKRAVRRKGRVTIMFIDLDGFKRVNDSFGHRTGDLLLKELAMRLISCVRASDCVARVGGDEFLILLEDVSDKSEIRNLAGKIISTLSQRIDIGGDIVQLGASIEISAFPKNGKSVNELINKADQAMYEIKNSGKNNFAFA